MYSVHACTFCSDLHVSCFVLSCLQVNVQVLSLLPKGKANDTLIYQMLHLRLSLDAITRLHELGLPQIGAGMAGPTKLTVTRAPGSDLLMLHARQQLTGRGRQPQAPGQPVRLGSWAT